MSTIKVDEIYGETDASAVNFPNKFKVGGLSAEQGYTASGSEPSSPSNGDYWWDTGNDKLYRYIDSGFKELGVAAASIAWGGDRGILAGGHSYNNTIQYWDITTQANGSDFGDLVTANEDGGGTSNGTRGVVWTAKTSGSGFPGGYSNNIDYFATATTGNASDFGDSTCKAARRSCLSDGTYGLCAVGAGDVGSGSSYGDLDVIEYITIANTGNATDFGNLSAARSGVTSTNDATRGVFIGGYDGTNFLNVMEYVTIGTPGNATDFGNDLTTNYMGTRGVMADGTYGVWHNGYTGSAYYSNVIAYITVQSTGNATDFGDYSTTIRQTAGASNSTKGHLAGGRTTVTSGVNNIEEITIATPGNSTDFADLHAGMYEVCGLSGAAS
jgi:hypothetical protein